MDTLPIIITAVFYISALASCLILIKTESSFPFTKQFHKATNTSYIWSILMYVFAGIAFVSIIADVILLKDNFYTLVSSVFTGVVLFFFAIGLIIFYFEKFRMVRGAFFLVVSFIFLMGVFIVWNLMTTFNFTMTYCVYSIIFLLSYAMFSFQHGSYIDLEAMAIDSVVGKDKVKRINRESSVLVQTGFRSLLFGTDIAILVVVFVRGTSTQFIEACTAVFTCMVVAFVIITTNMESLRNNPVRGFVVLTILRILIVLFGEEYMLVLCTFILCLCALAFLVYNILTSYSSWGNLRNINDGVKALGLEQKSSSITSRREEVMSWIGSNTFGFIFFGIVIVFAIISSIILEALGLYTTPKYTLFGQEFDCVGLSIILFVTSLLFSTQLPVIVVLFNFPHEQHQNFLKKYQRKTMFTSASSTGSKNKLSVQTPLKPKKSIGAESADLNKSSLNKELSIPELQKMNEEENSDYAYVVTYIKSYFFYFFVGIVPLVLIALIGLIFIGFNLLDLSIICFPLFITSFLTTVYLLNLLDGELNIKQFEVMYTNILPFKLLSRFCYAVYYPGFVFIGGLGVYIFFAGSTRTYMNFVFISIWLILYFVVLPLFQSYKIGKFRLLSIIFLIVGGCALFGIGYVLYLMVDMRLKDLVMSIGVCIWVMIWMYIGLQMFDQNRRKLGIFLLILAIGPLLGTYGYMAVKSVDFNQMGGGGDAPTNTTIPSNTTAPDNTTAPGNTTIPSGDDTSGQLSMLADFTQSVLLEFCGIIILIKIARQRREKVNTKKFSVSFLDILLICVAIGFAVLYFINDQSLAKVIVTPSFIIVIYYLIIGVIEFPILNLSNELFFRTPTLYPVYRYSASDQKYYSASLSFSKLFLPPIFLVIICLYAYVETIYSTIVPWLLIFAVSWNCIIFLTVLRLNTNQFNEIKSFIDEDTYRNAAMLASRHITIVPFEKNGGMGSQASSRLSLHEKSDINLDQKIKEGLIDTEDSGNLTKLQLVEKNLLKLSEDLIVICGKSKDSAENPQNNENVYQDTLKFVTPDSINLIPEEEDDDLSQVSDIDVSGDDIMDLPGFSGNEIFSREPSPGTQRFSQRMSQRMSHRGNSNSESDIDTFFGHFKNISRKQKDDKQILLERIQMMNEKKDKIFSQMWELLSLSRELHLQQCKFVALFFNNLLDLTRQRRQDENAKIAKFCRSIGREFSTDMTLKEREELLVEYKEWEELMEQKAIEAETLRIQTEMELEIKKKQAIDNIQKQKQRAERYSNESIEDLLDNICMHAEKEEELSHEDREVRKKRHKRISALKKQLQSNNKKLQQLNKRLFQYDKYLVEYPYEAVSSFHLQHMTFEDKIEKLKVKMIEMTHELPNSPDSDLSKIHRQLKKIDEKLDSYKNQLGKLRNSFKQQAKRPSSKMSQAEIEGNVTYYRQLRKLKQENRIFEDKEFTNEDAFGMLKMEFPNVEWKHVTDPVLYQENSIESIVHGLIQDEWLLDAISVLMDDDHAYKCIVKYDLDVSIFLVQLKFDSQNVYIVVDGCLPFYQNNHLLTHSIHPKDIWIPIIEKAVAKLYGSFDAIANNFTINEGVSLLSSGFSKPMEIAQHKFFWNSLQQRVGKCEYTFFCSSKVISNVGELNDGLIQGGSFVILDTYEVLNEGKLVKLLKMKHVHESCVWTGEWSNYSMIWNRRLKKQVDFESCRNFEFFIAFSDFQREFINLFQHIHVEHMYSAFANGKWEGEKCQTISSDKIWKAPQFEIEFVQPPDVVYLTVMIYSKIPREIAPCFIYHSNPGLVKNSFEFEVVQPPELEYGSQIVVQIPILGANDQSITLIPLLSNENAEGSFSIAAFNAECPIIVNALN
eukprot:TRINITY_DN2712_c0_g1_i1.p1 TRINITY_DN2712_c0_g1~~TRINITY_DN2712_c0_g1_i1.p1  ORF type:complete len:1840 (+),score=373.81 TRINITY_DN2712_c0_g1_i1:108-5627(+)